MAASSRGPSLGLDTFGAAPHVKFGVGRVFFKFVPWGGGAIIRDTLSCLRLIACNEGTQRDLSRELYEGAYAAWRKARSEIFQEWTFATDPANLQPRVRPALRARRAATRCFAPASAIGTAATAN